MKVTVWALASSGDGFDEVELFTSFEAANLRAIEMAEAEWERVNPGTPMPADWVDTLEQMRGDTTSFLYIDITHHDLDLVELIEASKSVKAAA